MEDFATSQASIYGGFDSLSELGKVVNLVVGGIHYSIEHAHLQRFPDCYFSLSIKSIWKHDPDAAVLIDRDGHLFRSIYNFIYWGTIDCPNRSVDSLPELLSIRTEADFYNLTELVSLCDTRILKHFQLMCQKDNALTRSIQFYHCVNRSDDPTELVNILGTFKAPMVETGTVNSFPSTHTTRSFKTLDGPAFHNCRRVAESFQNKELMELASLLHTWPLPHNVTTRGNYGLNTRNPRVFEYSQGGYCTGRSHVSSHDNIGMFLYIYRTSFTGGTVRCTVYDTTYTISQPGECMAIQAGCAYTVDTVTSGTLYVIEIDVTRRPSEELTAPPEYNYSPDLKWTNYIDGAHPSIGVDRLVAAQSSLLCAVNRELVQYSGVVICLDRYCSVTASTCTNKLFATNTDTLSDLEDALYMLLSQHYTATLVTVYVQYTSGTNTTRVSGFVLDSVPMQGAEVRMIVPPFGLGETFQSENELTKVRSYGTILTGIYIEASDNDEID